MDFGDSVENEWLCHAILKVYEIPIANTEMLSFEGIKVLDVKRFDRCWSMERS